MKKIGLFIDVDYASGGTFQYNQQILEALSALRVEKYHVVVFYKDDRWLELIPHELERIQISYPTLTKRILKALFGIGVPAFVIKFLFSLTSLKTVGSQKCDLVIFPSQDLAGLFIADGSVNVVHDLMHRYEPRFKESSGGGRGRFRDRLFGSMGKFSKIVLVDSQVGKNQFVESYGEPISRVEVLPYIAPAHITTYNDDKHKEFFEKINLPEKFIFYPAQFWPHKNHFILLQALSQLKSKLPDLHFVFTGPKRYEYDHLFSYCKANRLEQHVTFCEYVPNDVLGGFYKRATAMVMPTFYGPTNIPPLEAVALECPVAVSKIYGMPDQLKDATLYFDNTSVNDVAKCLETLWVDKEMRLQLIANGRQHFKNWNKAQFSLRLSEIIDQYFHS